MERKLEWKRYQNINTNGKYAHEKNIQNYESSEKCKLK